MSFFRTRMWWIMLLAVAMAVVATSWYRGNPVTAPASGPAANPAVEALLSSTFTNANGQTQALDAWRGHWLLVNFWATWCAPCVAEMPDLNRARLAPAASGVQFVGIGTENPDKVALFQQRMQLGFPLLAGNYEALDLARRLGNGQGVLPFTILIDPSGNIVQSQVGALAPGQIQDWLTHVNATH
jgi:peroxiredoxin